MILLTGAKKERERVGKKAATSLPIVLAERVSRQQADTDRPIANVGGLKTYVAVNFFSINFYFSFVSNSLTCYV